jgi:hypothetical protein
MSLWQSALVKHSQGFGVCSSRSRSSESPCDPIWISNVGKLAMVPDSDKLAGPRRDGCRPPLTSPTRSMKSQSIRQCQKSGGAIEFLFGGLIPLRNPSGLRARYRRVLPEMGCITAPRLSDRERGSKCRFSNRVSPRVPLTRGDAGCLTRCHRAFVSNSCHFFGTPLPIPWRHIRSPRAADRNPFGRFRHVTALSQQQLTHSPASVGDEDPAAQCIWHHRPWIVRQT